MEDCTMSFEFRRFRHAERGHGVYNGSTVGCTPSIGEYNDVARGDLAKFCEHSAAHRRNDSTLKSLCLRPGGDDRAGAFQADRQRQAQPAFDGSRSEEHTSELQSLMRISYAVFCLKKKKKKTKHKS